MQGKAIERHYTQDTNIYFPQDKTKLDDIRQDIRETQDTRHKTSHKTQDTIPHLRVGVGGEVKVEGGKEKVSLSADKKSNLCTYDGRIYPFHCLYGITIR